VTGEVDLHQGLVIEVQETVSDVLVKGTRWWCRGRLSSFTTDLLFAKMLGDKRVVWGLGRFLAALRPEELTAHQASQRIRVLPEKLPDLTPVRFRRGTVVEVLAGADNHMRPGSRWVVYITPDFEVAQDPETTFRRLLKNGELAVENGANIRLVPTSAVDALISSDGLRITPDFYDLD